MNAMCVYLCSRGCSEGRSAHEDCAWDAGNIGTKEALAWSGTARMCCGYITII